MLHALENGQSRVEIRTVDTDVVVLLIGKFFDLQAKYPLVDIWVAFGVGKHFQYIHVNSVCGKLGKDQSESFLLSTPFRAVIQLRHFVERARNLLYKHGDPSLRPLKRFLHVQQNPFVAVNYSSPHFKTLERLTVLMYDKRSTFHSVNAARRELFSKKGRTIEKIPPTQVTTVVGYRWFPSAF